ncbi:hypothetical protein LEP1GSC058_0473 [Leptospira fainei serovar Hurstbridge str. BUT 6]|uniref:Uncharacterized protein n=1 Tax=Leptospira fainei serovar Hurstbridge str. BUT 6 TaxID=1193011 RepID=S3UZH2_9LEPT|nr:hypothetical protein LEP1GSC058_0473 [Leptospira fainei serovar Hurstbridge str. BUT 6]
MRPFFFNSNLFFLLIRKRFARYALLYLFEALFRSSRYIFADGEGSSVRNMIEMSAPFASPFLKILLNIRMPELSEG